MIWNTNYNQWGIILYTPLIHHFKLANLHGNPEYYFSIIYQVYYVHRIRFMVNRNILVL